MVATGKFAELYAQANGNKRYRPDCTQAGRNSR
jgi:hypothetical protein